MLQLEFMTLLPTCAIYLKCNSSALNHFQVQQIPPCLYFPPSRMFSFYNIFKKNVRSRSVCPFVPFSCIAFFSIPFNAYFIYLSHSVSIVMNIKAVYNSLSKKRDWPFSIFIMSLIRIHSSIGDDF